MEVLSKRYNHDHTSSYKNRAQKLGPSNRFVRADRANKGRKAIRGDHLTKRRGLNAVSKQDVSIDDTENRENATKEKDVGKIRLVEKGKITGKGNPDVGQTTDQRKAMLLKWREQRELKKKAEATSKKTVFAVRHIQYSNNSSTSVQLNNKPAKKAIPKPTAPENRVTRSSARLASKQSSRLVTGGKTSVQNGKSAERAVATSKQPEEKPKRVTRQSIRSTTAARATPKPTKKNEDEQNDKKECPEGKKTSIEKEPSKQEKNSFAPSNYQFTAPTGVNTFDYYAQEFKFQPLSPKSADNFFQGISAFPSPTRDVITNQTVIPMSTAPLSIEESDSKITKKNRELNQTQACDKEIIVDKVDSSHFRNLVSSETTKLSELCDKWDMVLESNDDLTEDVKGNIRTAVGQAQLLISQRFKQFSGLIDLSEDESAEKRATMSDLQGFWDMIYFQVEDVNSKMDLLQKQKANGWVAEEKTVKKKKPKKAVMKKSKEIKSSKPGGNSKIQELRAAMKTKLAEKKLSSQNNEECSFITVLTPVKKSKKPGFQDNVILTPVRRSLRNTPINQSASDATPKIISTPKVSSAHSPGLRLTPEAPSTSEVPSSSNWKDSEMEKEKCERKYGKLPEEKTEENESEIKIKDESKEDCSLESSDDTKANTTSSTSDCTDEEIKDESLSNKRRSCLRSSTKRTRKSSRVFFQSPEPGAHSTAGGTPSAIVFTPGVNKGKRSTNVVFTPVAVSFNSPEEVHTCSIDAGHTPALVLSGLRSLRSRKGTPKSSRKRHLATSDGSMNTPQLNGDGGCVAKRRSQRRRSARTETSFDEESFLPDKYILSSTSSESDEDQSPQKSLSPLTAETPDASGHDQPLLSITPLKDSSNLFSTSSNLTPASRLQVLRLDDTPENRRDSVFFATDGQQQGQSVKDNLICFSPLAE